jgi:beta-glucosidase
MVSVRWLFAILACGSAQTSAQSVDTERLANVLFSIGLVPTEGLANAAASILIGGANATSQLLEEALSAPGIDERKRTQAELFYSYGHSPPVYPSRKLCLSGRVASIARANASQLRDLEYWVGPKRTEKPKLLWLR